jgi:CRP-like cAMP-binding protein
MWMQPKSIEEKKIFLMASANKERLELYSYLIRKHVFQATIYTSSDGTDALFKIENDPPHVLIIDSELNRANALDLASTIVKKSNYPNFGIIIVADIPDKEHLVDEVVIGKVQFFTDHKDEFKFSQCLMKGLNFFSQSLDSQYHLKFLAKNDVLFSEGDQATCAYIVKKGELMALRGIEDSKILLGKIYEGEFVGEMAHLNGEPRSATIQAATDCELIEIPFGTLDLVLFSKPAWSKALVMTLSKRLKNTNQVLAQNK